MNYEDKIILEKSIIAELLTDPNALVKIAGYLSEINFSEPLYKQIYKACESLYPNTIIEPFSVAKVTDIPMLTLLMESTHNLLPLHNIQYRAVLLIEFGIREQFIKVINKFHSETIPSSDKAIALSEILMYIEAEETDIFKAVAHTSKFVEENLPLYEAEHLAIIDFDNLVVKKCQALQKNKHVDSLYYHLENLYQFDYKKKEQLQCLSKITKYIMANPVSAELSNSILNLSTLL